MKVKTIASTFLDSSCADGSNSVHTVHAYSQDRKPIVTPPISADSSEEDAQQFLLIPNRDHILVMNMENGKNICKLTCGGGLSEITTSVLNTAAVMKLAVGVSGEESNDESKGDMDVDTTEYIVLAGFSDGTIKEWNLSAIPYAANKNVLPARRVFKVGVADEDSVSHITSPTGDASSLNYALVQTKNHVSKYVSFVIPSYSENGQHDIVTLENDCIATFSRNTRKTRKKNVGSGQQRTFVVNAEPFALSSTFARQDNGGGKVYICICHRDGLVIHDQKADGFVSLPMKQGQTDICAVAMSPNGKDIAIGYKSGKIDMIVSVLSQIADYLSAGGSDDISEKNHPKENLVTRTMHWHSLPVKTLCYLGLQGSRATPSLLSGGEEAVLVTWSVDRDLNRPTYTLPRIAKGAITHIATNSHPDSTNSGNMDIIVRCMDDSIQLIQAHNHATRWKVQGLACSSNECVAPVMADCYTDNDTTLPPVSLSIDPKSQTPILARMAGAPGLVHWFNPMSSQVEGEMEVAAFNRISRKEVHHKAYPRPTVTHFALSSSGNDMMTVDTMLSENAGVGNACKVKSFTTEGGDDLSEEMSFVTNLKFWSWSKEMERNAAEREKGMPYELIAAMPAPHGLTAGSVDGLAISPDGNKACTLSIEEGAFHIWTKGKTTIAEVGKGLAPTVPSWKRLCKIAIPSGYSNTSKTTNPYSGDRIAFSSDGSVLAIAFGRHITIWDHTSATLLNTICTSGSLRDIRFVRSPLDMILATGDSFVSLLAPFGNGYIGKHSWSYTLPSNSTVDDKKIQLGKVTTLVSRKEIGVALKQTKNETTITRVLLIDMITGKPKMTEDESTALFWDVRGEIDSLQDISHLKNEWCSHESVLLAITRHNEMVMLDTNETQTKATKRNVVQGCFARIQRSSDPLTSSGAPKIDNVGVKRKRIENNSIQTTKRPIFNSQQVTNTLLFDQSGLDQDRSKPIPTSRLPSLNGTFARSLFARNMSK